MDIAALPPTQSPALRAPVPPVHPPHQEVPAAAGRSPHASPREAGASSPAPAPPPGPRVTAEVSEPYPGQQVVSFVDSRTGEVISQLPSAQVLNLVMSFVETIRRREASGAVDHR